MAVNVYVKVTKLSNVTGRVDYISSPKRQENLLAVAGTPTDPEFWQWLAEDSQTAWRCAGGHAPGNRCCEAREIHGDLPRCALRYDPQSIAEILAKDFKSVYGADCLVAIHQNKTKTNVHYHLIFSERELLQEPEIHRATRNVFLDENGIRKRTKKEILDADGKLCSGCKIVPKGEIISVRRFGKKNELFAQKSWLRDSKTFMANWINNRLQPDERREVYDRNGPYLPQQHIGKGRPAKQEERIRQYNERVKEFNKLVRTGEITLDDAKKMKAAVMTSSDRLFFLNLQLPTLLQRRRGALRRSALDLTIEEARREAEQQPRRQQYRIRDDDFER